MKITAFYLLLISFVPFGVSGQSNLEQAFSDESGEKMQRYLSEWASDNIPDTAFTSDTIAAVHAVYSAFFHPQTFKLYANQSMSIRPQPGFVLLQSEIRYVVFSSKTDAVWNSNCRESEFNSTYKLVYENENLKTLPEFRPKVGLDSALFISNERGIELYEFVSNRSREQAAEAEMKQLQLKWQDKLEKREDKGKSKKPRCYRKQRKAIKADLKAAKDWGMKRQKFLHNNGLRIYLNSRMVPVGPRSLVWADGRPTVRAIVFDGSLKRARVFFRLSNSAWGWMNFDLNDDAWIAQDHCLICLSCGE